MVDGEAPASSRVSAARIVLETAIRGVELLDLEVRVEQLEQAQLLKGVNRWTS